MLLQCFFSAALARPSEAACLAKRATLQAYFFSPPGASCCRIHLMFLQRALKSSTASAMAASIANSDACCSLWMTVQMIEWKLWLVLRLPPQAPLQQALLWQAIVNGQKSFSHITWQVVLVLGWRDKVICCHHGSLHMIQITYIRS